MPHAALSAFFAGRSDVIAAWLFGSHAEGRAHRESDVDVGVLLDRALLPDRRTREEMQVRIISELIAELKRNEVDVVILNDAPPLLARRIIRSGTLLHAADAETVHAFKRNVQLLAADLEPFVRRHRQRLLETFRR